MRRVARRPSAQATAAYAAAPAYAGHRPPPAGYRRALGQLCAYLLWPLSHRLLPKAVRGAAEKGRVDAKPDVARARFAVSKAVALLVGEADTAASSCAVLALRLTSEAVPNAA